MRELTTAAVAGFVFAAAAFALPADLVVISDREVRPDEAGGLYYLGQGGGGYLYNCSNAATARVAPYRVLDRDAQTKDYYIVWAPAWVGVTPQAFAHLGTAVRLSEYEILVGLERGFGPGELRAVEHRVELNKLVPVTPVDWKADAEAPPTKVDPRIEGAIKTITAAEYASYIEQLQDFKTRYTDTAGSDAARDYIRNFFALQNLDSTLFPFECIEMKHVYYPEADGKIYVLTDYNTFKRTGDGGLTWDNFWPTGTGFFRVATWLSSDVGFAADIDGRLAKTTDGGYTWDVSEFARPRAGVYYLASDIFFADEDVGWVGGEVVKTSDAPEMEVLLKKTVDGGRTWRDQKVPEGDCVARLEFYDVKYGWAGISKPIAACGILYTEDGGSSWTKCNTPADTAVVTDFAATGPRKAWAVAGGRLLRTTDGASWAYVDPGIPGSYQTVEFPDVRHGYVGGDKSLIATDDGGATWREIKTAPAISYSLLAFADKTHGVVGDTRYYNKRLYRTEDGGNFAKIMDGMDLTAENVLGERRGAEVPDEIIIIGGHFDSFSGMVPSCAPGADDNASGAACAMAAARAFRNITFRRTVRYVAFGDEENGLSGSRSYAKHCVEKGEKIIAVLNADMVCYDEEAGARDDFAVDYSQYGWLFDYLKAVGGLYGNGLIYEEGLCGSDQRSFWDAGYVALGVIEGAKGKGGLMAYPWYHSTEDTLDKLQPELGVRFVRDYAAMLAHLAGVGDYLFEPTPAGTASVPFARPFSVYPNPFCYATCAGGVNFVGLKAPARVEIYDLAGRRVAREEVATGRDAYLWRPAGIGGAALSPGVYLYRVEGQGQEESGKVVIAR